MRKPAAIIKLEGMLGIKIPKRPKYGTQSRRQPHYVSNNASQITAVSLGESKIKRLSLICEVLGTLPQLTWLNFGDNQISDLAPLKQLTSLQTLYIDYNKIRSIGPLAELSKIEDLRLDGNKIDSLEPLMHLSKLRNLSVCKLTNLDTQSLAHLTQLKNLDASSTGIGDISFLRSLPNLASLELDENPIKDVSVLQFHKELNHLSISRTSLEEYSALSTLSKLSFLDISNAQIGDITFLKSLLNLKYLLMIGAKHANISALSSLKNLTFLALARNGISDISPIKNLSELKFLNLSRNLIVDIAPIKGLSSLNHVDLSFNRVFDITPLATLDRLTEVDISYNQVKVFPASLLGLNLPIGFELPTNHGIELNGNPFSTPPLEIIRQGRDAIAKWLEEDKVFVNEVKVLLVGHGDVGKTTLVKTLLGKPPDPDEPSTYHININNYQLDHKGKSVKLNFWDFGGQEVMHSTHQFFLSTRSIYLLLLDGRRDEDAEYWLKHIESFGGNSPVLVVLNKIDTNPSFDVDRRFLQTKYTFIKGFYRTACLHKQLGITELWEGIGALLSEVEILSSAWPKSWLDIKEGLESMTNNFISQEGYESLCASSGVNDEFSRTVLADYLNDLGIIVHFKDLKLSNLHILQPRWASRAAYKIINADRIAKNHGLFKADWLSEIMKKQDENDFDYPGFVFPYILDLLQKFELCYSVNEGCDFLIPELMDIQQPVLPSHKGPVLRFFLKFEDLLPRSIITRFIVRMHEDIKDDLRWRTGTVLQVDIFKTLAIVIADLKERKIHISVSGPNRKEHFAIIRKTFHSLTHRFQRLNMTEWIPLPDAEGYSVEYEELFGYEANKKEEIFFGKLGRSYKVADLLNGIEPENIRKQEYKWSVFICHSSLDKPIVQEIAHDLVEAGIPYWLDEEQIIPGDSIIDKITEGLQQSNAIVLCVSKNQLRSGWSRKEYNSVLNRIISGFSNQRIVPMVLDDTPDSEMPPLLSDIKNLKYADKEAYSSFLAGLLAAQLKDYEIRHNS